MSTARQMGELFLQVCEKAPREDAIDALAMAITMFLKSNEMEFFNSCIITQSIGYDAETKH